MPRYVLSTPRCPAIGVVIEESDAPFRLVWDTEPKIVQVQCQEERLVLQLESADASFDLRIRILSWVLQSLEDRSEVGIRLISLIELVRGDGESFQRGDEVGFRKPRECICYHIRPSWPVTNGEVVGLKEFQLSCLAPRELVLGLEILKRGMVSDNSE